MNFQTAWKQQSKSGPFNSTLCFSAAELGWLVSHDLGQGVDPSHRKFMPWIWSGWSLAVEKTWVELAGKPCLGETEHFWRLGFGDLAGMGNDYGRTSVSEGLYESIRWHTMAYCATSVAFFDDMLLWWYNSWVGLKENHHRKPRFCLPLKIGFMGGVRRPSTRKARSKDVGLQAKPYRTVPMVLHGCWRWLVSVYGYWHHGYSWFSNYQMVINEMWMVVVPCVLYFWTIFVCSTLSFGSFSQLNVGLSECSGGPSLRWILHGLCDHNLPALLNALAKLRRHQGKQKPSTA